MNWPIRIVKPGTHLTRQIGDAWFYDEKYPLETLDLSKYYYANNRHRRPLHVVLPSKISKFGLVWLVDGCTFIGGVKQPDGHWVVTGDPPNINVWPSINIKGHYHGFIQNGIIGSDVD